MSNQDALQSTTALAPAPRPALKQTLPVLYTGPAIPTIYVPQWRRYPNLTLAQTEWFRKQPEDLVRYAGERLNAAHALKQITHSSGVVVTPLLNGAGLKFSLPGKDIRTVATADITAAHAAYAARYHGLR